MDQLQAVGTHLSHTMTEMGEVFQETADDLNLVLHPLDSVSRRLGAVSDQAETLAGTAQDMVEAYAAPVIDAAERIGQITIDMLVRLSLVMQSRLMPQVQCSFSRSRSHRLTLC